MVLGIIAVLAAILLPVLSSAREKARRTQCLNNMRQISLAIQQYTQPPEEKYPKEWGNNTTQPQTTPNSDSPTGAYCNRGFDAAIMPHLGNRKVFVCPSDKFLLANTTFPTNGSRANWDDTSYAINQTVQGEPLVAVPNISDTIALGHTRFEHVLWKDKRSVIWNTHQGANNYGFCDGHVSFLKQNQTLLPRDLWIP